MVSIKIKKNVKKTCLKKSWVMDGWEKNKKNIISHIVGEEKSGKGSMIPKNVILGVYEKFESSQKK